MIFRRRKKLRDLARQLHETRREHEQLVREGREREPRLRRLEREFQDNQFLERLIASMEQTRRRHT
jgi:hypothetical protein